jgi:Bacterial Ig-like domain (group 3)
MRNLSGGGLPLFSPRRCILIGALAVAGALSAAPAAFASGTFTWSGTAGPSSRLWSNPANWSPSGAPPAGTSAFDFSGPCASPCESVLDVSGITAQGLTVADDTGVLLLPSAPNEGLTLESPSTGNALNAVTTGGSNGAADIDLPITLDGDQSWNIAGSTGAGGPVPSGLVFEGTIIGTGDALTVGMSGQSELLLQGGVATGGAVTVNGANSADSGPESATNGTLEVVGPLNAGGGTVTVNDVDATFNGATTGPLAVHGSELSTTIGEPAGTTPGQGLTVNGALTMDASDTTEILLGSDTSTPAVSVTGNATVGGQLALLEFSEAATCSVPTLGATQTVVQSQGGTLSGTFTDTSGKTIPNGGITNLTFLCASGTSFGAEQTFPARVNYTSTAVTVTNVAQTTTSLSRSAASVPAGQSETLTAAVAPFDPTSGSPTGDVAFSDGGTPVACANSAGGNAPVSADGVATCTTSFATTGSHAITAAYSGDGSFATSSSPARTVTVGPALPPPAAPKAGTGVSTVSAAVTKPGAQAVTVPLRCAAGGASCTVTVRLTTVRTVHRHGKIVRRTVVLGSKRVTVAAGKSKRVKVKLTKAGRTLLTTDKKLATKVSVTSTTSAGTKHTAVKRLTLKAKATTGAKRAGVKHKHSGRLHQAAGA